MAERLMRRVDTSCSQELIHLVPWSHLVSSHIVQYFVMLEEEWETEEKAI